jgi:hypothetical protein
MGSGATGLETRSMSLKRLSGRSIARGCAAVLHLQPLWLAS